MENLSSQQRYDDTAYVDLAFVNRGDKKLFSGEGSIATITVKAKADCNVADVIDLSTVTLIGPDYSYIESAIKNDITIPEIPLVSTAAEYGREEFDITMTNDVLTEDKEGTNVEKSLMVDLRKVMICYLMVRNQEDNLNLFGIQVKMF